MSPVSTSRRMPRTGSSVCSSRTSSPWMRSGLTIDRVARSSAIAATVAGSTSKPSWAEKRAARSIRSGSSPKLTRGIGGRAQPARDEVLDPAGRIDQRARGHAQRHRVDREVAAREVALEGVAELDGRLAGHAVVAVGAVGRDLDLLARDPRADRAERAPDVPLGGADRLDDPQDLVGPRVRGEVEVVASRGRAARRARGRRRSPARCPASANAAAERRDDRRLGERAQARHSLGHVEHASSLPSRRARSPVRPSAHAAIAGTREEQLPHPRQQVRRAAPRHPPRAARRSRRSARRPARSPSHAPTSAASAGVDRERPRRTRRPGAARSPSGPPRRACGAAPRSRRARRRGRMPRAPRRRAPRAGRGRRARRRGARRGRRPRRAPAAARSYRASVGSPAAGRRSST